MVKSMDILVKGDKIWPILELTVQNFHLLFDLYAFVWNINCFFTQIYFCYKFKIL